MRSRFIVAILDLSRSLSLGSNGTGRRLLHPAVEVREEIQDQIQTSENAKNVKEKASG